MGAAQVRFVPTLAGQNHQRGGSQSLERMVRISSMNGPQSLELSVSITGIHNPQGEVVDAYFSNLGNRFIQGADKPINSLIHHLNLDGEKLIIPKIVTYQYQSLFTAPYWNKIDADIHDVLQLGGALK